MPSSIVDPDYGELRANGFADPRARDVQARGDRLSLVEWKAGSLEANRSAVL